jgi:hypothetical protein
MKVRKMATRKMQQPGHYRRPMAKVPGRMNAPRRGRPGKMMPTMKRMSPKVRRGK